MQLSKISKSEAIPLAVPFVGAYLIGFCLYNLLKWGQWPDFTSGYGLLYLVGVLIHMMAYFDRPMELTFGTKRTGTIWSDGLCILPNAGHSTISAFKFAIFWGIKPLLQEPVKEQCRSDDESNSARRVPDHLVLAKTSLLVSKLDRALDKFLFWFIGYKEGENHLIMMRFGFRVMIVAFSWATFVGAYAYGERKTKEFASQAMGALNSVAQGSLPQYGVPQPQEQSVPVKVSLQLKEGPSPVMPLPEYFKLNTGEPKTQWYEQMQGDSRKYFVYQDVPGGTFTLDVTESMCALVPPGRKIAFNTRRAPTNVIEMKTDVLYSRKRTEGNVFETVYVLLASRKLADSYPTRDSWKYLYHNWGKVETSTHKIVAEALPKKELDPGSGGGVVCF